MTHPKIFLATLTSQVKDYAWMRWYTNVEAMVDHYAGDVQLYVSDNSPTMDYALYLKRFDIQVGKVHPRGCASTEVLCESFNQIREAFLKSDSDLLCIVESDVIPPHDTLHRLVAWQLPIVSAVYFTGNGTDRFPMIIVGQEINGVYTTRLIEHDMLSYLDGTVKPAFASGMGCVLIHRTIVSQFPYRHIPNVRMHPDALFYQDLNQIAKTQHFVDTSIICKHYNQDWNQQIYLTKNIS
jgi:hypothetical protein